MRRPSRAARRRSRLLAIVLLFLPAAAAANPAEAPPVSPDERQRAEAALAEAALAEAALAYRAAPGLVDELSLLLETPGAEPQRKEFQLLLGAGTDVAFIEGFMKAFAIGDRLYLTQADAPDRYLSVPYDGDYAAALAGIFGGGAGLPEMAPISMRLGKGLDGWLEGLRFNLLGPLTLAGHRLATDAGGRPVDEITLSAPDGGVVLSIDRESRFFSQVDFHVEPAGAPEGYRIAGRLTFDPRVVDEPAGLVAFDPGERRAVDSLAALGSSGIEVGAPVPDFTLPTFDGRQVTLSDLAGKVVFLDFWATWCVPCWSTLEHADEIARWAEEEGLPVVVLAVNSLEQVEREARRDHAAKFWRSRGFQLPSLLDLDNEVFHRLGAPGLPSMMLIDRQGRLAVQHSGEFADPVATLKAEIEKLLAR